jgi:hypothetical protein
MLEKFDLRDERIIASPERERDEFRIGKAAQQAVAADRATRADRRLHRHLDGGPRLPMCPSFLFLFSRMMIKLNYSGKTLAEA